jgi:hypothetical protein
MKKRDWAKITYDGEKLVLSLDDGYHDNPVSVLTPEKRKEIMDAINRIFSRCKTPDGHDIDVEVSWKKE